MLARLRLDPRPAFLELAREHAAIVYRFHLALTGSVEQAQRCAKDTFLAAAGRLDSLPDPPNLLAAWLLETACACRCQPGETTDLQSPQPGSDGLDFQVFQIAEGLAQLPHYLALLMALHFFGGLDLPAIGRVFRAPAGRVERWAMEAFHAWLCHTQPSSSRRSPAEEASLAEDLFHFAGQVQPDPVWVETLLEELDGGLPRDFDQVRAPALENWRQRLDLPRGPRLPARRWLAGAIAVVLLILFMMVSFDLADRETLPPAAPRDMPAVVTLETDGTEPITNVVQQARIQGKWVPPRSEICKEWQERLGQALHTAVEITPSEQLTAMTSDSKDHGYGCTLTMQPGDVTVLGLDRLAHDILELLKAHPSFRDASFLEQLMSPPHASDRHFAISGVLSNPGYYAALMVGVTLEWDSICPDQGAYGCPFTLAGQPIFVRLELAEDRLQPRLQNFFTAWQTGDESLTQYLSGDLLEQGYTLEKLDGLLGISRGWLNRAEFSWKVIENSGSYVRIEGTVQNTLGSQPFQAIWRLESDQWRLSAISKGVLFPPTRDSIVAADETGRIYWLDLETGQRRAISQAGVYHPETDEDKVGSCLVCISPGADWLAVSSPSAAYTWILSLKNQGVVRIAHPASALSWTPDGKHLYLVLLNNPRLLYRIDPEKPVLQRVAQVDGEIRSLAWSPDGQMIALATLETRFSARQHRIGVEIYDPSVTRRLQAWSPPFNSEDIPADAFNISWTVDSQELWYQDRIALRPAEGSLCGIFVLEESLISYSTISGTVESESMQGERLALLYPSTDDTSIVAVQETRLGEINQVLRRVEKIHSLQWAAEGDNLILDGSRAKPGALYRMNAHTGEIAELDTGLFYIGLVSQLEKFSQDIRTPPQASLAADSVGVQTPPDEWPTFHQDFNSFTVRYPPGWSAVQIKTNPDTPSLVLTNLSFEDQSKADWVGKFSISPEATILTLSERWIDPGQGALRGIADLRRNVKTSIRLSERPVAGFIGYESEYTRPTSGGVYITIQIPTLYISYQVLYHPGRNADPAVFQAILDSIRFNSVPSQVAGETQLDLEPVDQERIDPFKANSQAEILGISVSPSGTWQAVVTHYACLPFAAGEEYQLDELSLVHLPSGQTTLVDQQISRCGQGKKVGDQRLFWSPNDKILYYSRGDVSLAQDACEYQETPLVAVDLTQTPFKRLPYNLRVGSLSPTGELLAFWQFSQSVVVWGMNGGEILRVGPGDPKAGTGPIAWSPDGERIAYLQTTQPGCPLSGKAFVQLFDREEPIPVETTQTSLFSSLYWQDENTLILVDTQDRYWSYSTADQHLTELIE